MFLSTLCVCVFVRARAHCLREGLQYIDYSCLVAYYCRAAAEFGRTPVNYTAQFTSQSSSLCSKAQPLLIFSFQTSPRGNDSNTKVKGDRYKTHQLRWTLSVA